MTIRDRIRVIQVALRDTAITADVARESDVLLTALLGNVNDELRAADVDYKRHLLACYGVEKTANRARLVAETGPQYERYLEAKQTRELVVEMIRSCRAFGRSLSEEMRLGSH